LALHLQPLKFDSLFQELSGALWCLSSIE
jgi:hypothetical protein